MIRPSIGGTMLGDTVLHFDVKAGVPSCLELGDIALEKGDYQLARQMLCASIKELDGCVGKEPQLIDLVTKVADTYLREGQLENANRWYRTALNRSETFSGSKTLQAACLMARLAQVFCLQSNIAESRKYLDTLLPAYLLTEEENTSVLLHPLSDLSWSLSAKKRTEEARIINDLIAQIKALEQEKRFALWGES